MRICTLRGAAMGALSGAVFGAIGAQIKAEGNWSTGKQIFVHGTAGGVMSTVQGGKFGHGFITAGIMKGVGKIQTGSNLGRTMIQSLVGGTLSKLTGGKFANGAVTSAIQYVVNEIGGLASAQKAPQQRANEIAAEITERGYIKNKGEADLLYELNTDPNLKVKLDAKYLTVDMADSFKLGRNGKLSAPASVRGFPFGQGGIHGNVMVVDRQDGTYGIYDSRYDYDMKSWINPGNLLRNLNTLMGPTSCFDCGTGYKTDFYGNVNMGSTR